MIGAEERQPIFFKAKIIILFLFLSFALCYPLLVNLFLSCSGDWDYFSFLYEIPSISLFEYHQFPLWNPYCGGGMTLIGNPQSGYLSPILLFTSVFGVFAGLKIAVWLHTFLGMWGMWLLSRHMGIQAPARFASPIVFMFSSCWAFHLAEGHIVWLPAAFLPFFFLLFLKGLTSKKRLMFAAGFETVMFYEGATYVLAYSLLILFVYVLADSVLKKSWLPLYGLIRVNILAAIFSAPKLLPVLETLANNPRITDNGARIPLKEFFQFFLDRSQSFRGSTILGGWWEYGCYLGVLGVSLYILSLTRWEKNKPILISSIFIALVAFGNFSEFAPWTALRLLPLFSGFKVSTRSMIVFVFSVALLVGLVLESMQRKREKSAVLFIAILVLFLGIDLFSVSHRVFSEAFLPSSIHLGKDISPSAPGRKFYRIAPASSTGLWRSVPTVHEQFFQISIPFEQRDVHGAWSDQYLPLLRNKGVVDAYETVPFRRYALPHTDGKYKGEYYFLGKGTVDIQEWSPNRFVYRVKSLAKGRLVINQNYWNGWRATSGMIQPFNGLLSVVLEKGEQTIAVYFLPYSFLLGVGIFAGSLIFMVIVYVKRRQ